jgi:hypothetical protein
MFARSILTYGFSENLPGASGSAVLEILVLRAGKTGAFIIWVQFQNLYSCYDYLIYAACIGLRLSHSLLRRPDRFARRFAHGVRFQP